MQCTRLILLQGKGDRALCTGHRLDIELLEEGDRPAAHASRQHDISPLALDEFRDLAGLVPSEEGVLYGLNR